MDDTSKTPSAALVHVDIPDFANTAAKNLTDSPTKAIGQTLTDLWQIIFGNRLSYAAERQQLKYAHELEEFKASLDAKIDAVPEEKKVEPSFQVVGQALEDAKYCLGSEELREMFSTLIANSVHANHAKEVHPSFSKIIQQLSPLDARMIKLFANEAPKSEMAIVNYIARDPEHGYETLLSWIPEFRPDSCSVVAAALSIASLQRLGLIAISTDEFFIVDDRYDGFRGDLEYSLIERKLEKTDYKIDIKKGVARLTSLGVTFVSVCLG